MKPDRADYYSDSHPNDLPQAPDCTVTQPVHLYSAQDHATWKALYERQTQLLQGRVCDEFLQGLSQLQMSADRVPNFNDLNAVLQSATGWQIVVVNGLVPDHVFFEHLANRRFPCTWWMRRPEQMDYLQEPDCFHDVFGHVPLLINPIFADYIQAYGEGGMKAQSLQVLPMLARLYWYTVEFGLIQTERGLRIYGAGIVSSKAESVYSLESELPNRIGFDLQRILRTEYKIDDMQKTYFVINSFTQLFQETRADFTQIYEQLKHLPSFSATEVLPYDQLIARTESPTQ